ncbi:malate synthase A [Candidatus Peribacteria bacterium RIFCSPHIGHO2_01_FULL_49_38]|nr:MAG: malate synthase A [Candidatus Peribacteria bacterium RIFCSPHIGHO2_01_FULL_49_38]
MTTAAHCDLMIHGKIEPEFSQILTHDALQFVIDLQRIFGDRIDELLAERRERQACIDAGDDLDFLPETKAIRESDWRVNPVSEDLLDRRVEITGPVDRKMVINALNSGASVFMADFEDSQSPTWEGLMQGQVNVRDAVRGSIVYEDSQSGKQYALHEKTAKLAVRPRGLHLPEAHLEWDGVPMSGSLVDFGLSAWHNAKNLVDQKKTPFFYLPKLEHHNEAKLWNDIFERTEDRLDLARGTIKATVLIETFPAAFQMNEILYALKNHSAGLNCGRWDYIFSIIKTYRNRPWIMPDRRDMTMTAPNMRSYVDLAIQTCHKRGTYAMGGMAAQIPIKSDPEANAVAMEKVRADKKREAQAGHDGTWVAHPGLIEIALEEFDAVLQGRLNQVDRLRDDVQITAVDIRNVPVGAPTLQGLRTNISVAVAYLESWLRGKGCVPLYNLMEDAATAEISGAQVWHWLHHATKLDDGTPITIDLVHQVLDEEMRKEFSRAREIFETAVTSKEMPDFLTLRAYPHLLQ